MDLMIELFMLFQVFYTTIERVSIRWNLINVNQVNPNDRSDKKLDHIGLIIINLFVIDQKTSHPRTDQSPSLVLLKNSSI